VRPEKRYLRETSGKEVRAQQCGLSDTSSEVVGRRVVKRLLCKTCRAFVRHVGSVHEQDRSDVPKRYNGCRVHACERPVKADVVVGSKCTRDMSLVIYRAHVDRT
jgi:hypothetical protein